MTRLPRYGLAAAARVAPPSILPLVVAAVAVAMWVLADDWIAGLAVVILWSAWRYLEPDVGPPVIPLAFTFQWTQVTSGIFYYALTGRQVPAMYETDYRPMVLIGLGCLVALLIGLRSGMRLLSAPRPRPASALAVSQPTLIGLYIGSMVVTEGLRQLAWWIPQLTQPIVMLSYCRYGLLFLVLRRLSSGRVQWGWIATILTGSLLFGFTGYFAEFREVIFIATLVLLERFDRRQLRHWVGLGTLAALATVLALLWMSIKGEYRSEITGGALSGSRIERLQRVGELADRWFDSGSASMWEPADSLVHRLWAIYFPALAVSRVPAILPYERGAILGRAIRHVLMPRVLFPEKEGVPSDSEMVRKYSGVWVAGPEQGTSIAFGYAVESYIDFGIPWMFLPVLIYGLIMGVAYQFLVRTIRHEALAAALVSVIFWMSLYQYERSWILMLGFAGTLLFYVGGAGIVLDRWLATQRPRGLARAPGRPGLARRSIRTPTNYQPRSGEHHAE